MKNIPILVFILSILAIASCHKDNTPPCENVCLISPGYDEKNVDFLPVFRWEPVEGVTEYNFQLNAREAFDPNYNYYDTIVSATSFSGNPNDIWLILGYLENYYWRVRAIKNGVPGEWSTVWKFTTRDARDGIAGTFQADKWDCTQIVWGGGGNNQNNQVYRGKTTINISLKPNDRDIYFSCPDENISETLYCGSVLQGLSRCGAGYPDGGGINVEKDSFYFKYTYYEAGHISEYWIFKGKME